MKNAYFLRKIIVIKLYDSMAKASVELNFFDLLGANQKLGSLKNLLTKTWYRQ